MDHSIHFTCSDRDIPDAPWPGWLEPLATLGPAVTLLHIVSRSAFQAIVGDTGFGNFICLPDWGVGAYLSDYSDLFFNKERLIGLLGPIDGVTIACALHAASKAGLI